jgi:heme-degrading monooxygenase HmoA
MYLIRSEWRVKAGYTAEFEERRWALAETARGMQGYLGETLLHSYSHPAKYALTQRFDDVEAAWAYDRNPALSEILRLEPSDAVTVTQQEGYVEVHEVDAENMPATVGCEIVVDEVLKAVEVAPAFEGTLHELFELRKTHAPGYGYNRLYRSGGRLGRYLVIQGYSDLGAAGRANLPPQVQAFLQAHPDSQFIDEAVQPEAYAVLYRT